MTDSKELVRVGVVEAHDIDNPYWEAVKDHPDDKFGGFGRGSRRSIESYVWEMEPFGDRIKGLNKKATSKLIHRTNAVVRWSWSIPDPVVLNWLYHTLDGRPVVEMGAGTGYWAWMMSQMGINWTAYDISPPSQGKNKYHSNAEGQSRADVVDQQYVNILEGDHLELRRKVNRNKVLFLSWPPYDKPMAADCLKAFKGDTFVYVGEGDGGCTGDDEFHQILRDQWDEVDHFPMVQWSGIHDNMHVYTRKPKKYGYLYWVRRAKEFL